MHWYKRNIGDYYKKAGRLSMMQHGAYTLLIDACYDREQFPTMEQAIEWVWASTEDEIQAVKFVLTRFFVEVDGVFVQARIKDELADYRGKAEKNRQIAMEREAKRREKRTNEHVSCTDVARRDHESPPNQEPVTSNQEPITSKEIKSKATAVAKPADAGIDFSPLCMTGDQIDEVKRIRRKNKGGTLTQRVINGLAKEFELAANIGWGPEDILSEWELRGWRSFKAEWVKPKGGSFDGMSAISRKNAQNLAGDW